MKYNILGFMLVSEILGNNTKKIDWYESPFDLFYFTLVGLED